MNTADCYVYILYREDGLTPFYVGKGRGDRWLAHEANAKRGRSHKDNIICQMKAKGIVVPKRKVAEGLTDADALALEIKLIAEIGRMCDGGPLTNLTAGGDGLTNPTPEVRAQIAESVRKVRTGWRISPETAEKIAAAHRGKKRGPRPHEERERRAQEMREAWGERSKERPGLTMKGRRHSDETKAKMRAAALGRTISEEQRQAIRTAQLGRKQSVETIQKRAEANRGKKRSQEFCEMMRNRKHSEQSRAKMSAAQIGHPVSDQARANMSKAQLGKKQSPERRARASEIQKAIWARRKAEANG